MRVPPISSPQVGPTENSILSPKTAGKFETQSISEKKSPQAALIGAEDIISDVKSLAQDFKSGAITKEEASKRFVAIVVEKRHDLSSLGVKGKHIEDAVREVAGDDPHFVMSLSRQLQKLAAS